MKTVVTGVAHMVELSSAEQVKEGAAATPRQAMAGSAHTSHLMQDLTWNNLQRIVRL
jgi:hypothetical protein